MKDWISQQLRGAIVSEPGIKARRWLGLGGSPVANHEMDRIPVAGEVVVYFSDPVNKAYQLEQWLPTLERLHETHRVVLVFRKVPALRHFRKLTSLPKIFVRRLEDLVNLYAANDFRLCLYVNNGVANFQSLSAPHLVHVHINHGESDKLSMVSNQAKAYDRTFVAGPAAVERHKAVLSDFDMDKLISVGRPQLDGHFTSILPDFAGRTVMYAPTWEGENEANNYTSMDLFGLEIVESLMAIPNTRVIYKPHPRIATSNTAAIVSAHTSICELLEQSNADGAQHEVIEKGNILDIFEDVDALVTDVSSVGLDYLYLHPENQLILTDRHSDINKLHRDVPISRACPVISESNRESTLGNMSELLAATQAQERKILRDFYFGLWKRGESTDAFISALGALIEQRAAQLREKDYDGGPGSSLHIV